MKKRPSIIKTAESDEICDTIPVKDGGVTGEEIYICTHPHPFRLVVKFLAKIFLWIVVPMVLAIVVCEIFGWGGTEYTDSEGRRQHPPSLIEGVLWLVFLIVGLKLRSLIKRFLKKNGPTD